MRKVKAIPNDTAQLEAWAARLKDLGASYEIVTHAGRPVIELDETIARDLLQVPKQQIVKPQLISYDNIKFPVAIFQKGSLINRIATGILVIGLGMYIAHSGQSESTNSDEIYTQEADIEVLTPEEQEKRERLEQIAECFLPDGSHLQAILWIKRQMQNPKSFEHVETKYLDKGDYIAILTTFRGTNSFGAVVTQRCIAKADLNCNIIEAAFE